MKVTIRVSERHIHQALVQVMANPGKRVRSCAIAQALLDGGWENISISDSICKTHERRIINAEAGCEYTAYFTEKIARLPKKALDFIFAFDNYTDKLAGREHDDEWMRDIVQKATLPKPIEFVVDMDINHVPDRHFSLKGLQPLAAA